MAVIQRPWAADLHHYWFHELSPRDWYRRNPTVDDELRRRFGDVWAMLRHRPVQDFVDGPHGTLAAVLLFDQVPRNIFRGDPHSFASDPLAQALVHASLAKGWHRALTRSERQFLYMPLMHSEDIADQRLSVALFAQLGQSLSFARSHYAMVARFGRFPHRNDVLGRETTEAEAQAIAAGHAW